MIDLDFEILHSRYLVLKVNLGLHFVNLTPCDTTTLKKVNIDLRPGQIT